MFHEGKSMCSSFPPSKNNSRGGSAIVLHAINTLTNGTSRDCWFLAGQSSAVCSICTLDTALIDTLAKLISSQHVEFILGIVVYQGGYQCDIPLHWQRVLHFYLEMIAASGANPPSMNNLVTTACVLAFSR